MFAGCLVTSPTPTIFWYAEWVVLDPGTKSPPPYAIASVDCALRAATMLQLEGALTVSEVAERLGVARSTAHRVLSMLVYRDFAVQDSDRVYCPGPVLELATHSQSRTSRLRAVSSPHLERLVEALDESVNVTIRTGDVVRFIASAECRQVLRVGAREGMVFPAHKTTAGLLLLSELAEAEVEQLYAVVADGDGGRGEPVEAVDVRRLVRELAKVRRAGFAVNLGRSERGVVAVGVPVRDGSGKAVAGLSVSMPSVRYDAGQLPSLVGLLRRTAHEVGKDLTAAS